MTVYVGIGEIRGRIGFLALAAKLDERGFSDRVEYNPGGWQDHSLYIVRPHLKFESEDDALAYVLAFGGEISKNPPNIGG